MKDKLLYSRLNDILITLDSLIILLLCMQHWTQIDGKTWLCPVLRYNLICIQVVLLFQEGVKGPERHHLSRLCHTEVKPVTPIRFQTACSTTLCWADSDVFSLCVFFFTCITCRWAHDWPKFNSLTIFFAFHRVFCVCVCVCVLLLLTFFVPWF